MKKSEANNTFSEGLIMDLNPMVTPNNVVTNALNATLITFNGNEYSLQNDMGNGRVETAYLPEGFIPLGTAELGGIIYIVSYNPLRDKCLIGCFPSPERNITTDELGETEKVLSTLDFYNDEGMIVTSTRKLILVDTELNPGDKFQIWCEQLADVNYISAKLSGNTDPDLYPRYLKFNVVAVLEDGTITNLNDTLVWQENDYYILENEITSTNGKIDLDEYRNLVNSNYNVFMSKSSGQLAILAELECIEQFDVSWDAIKDESDLWNIYLYLNWNYDNDSARDQINLYSVRVDCDAAVNTTNEIVITNYPKSANFGTDNDIMNNSGITFYTPYYVDDIEETPDYNTNGGITTARYNDGSDNQFLLTTPIVLNADASGIVTFTVYPGMPFGYLAYLASTFSINVDKLGTGEIDLVEYRYYWNSNSITLNWGLDAYPERNKEIKSISFEFYEFTEDVYSWACANYINVDDSNSFLNDGEDTWEDGTLVNFPNISPYYTYTVSGLSSYSGNFTDSISSLENYLLYLVKIVINYNNEKYIEYYRFMYTSNLFNDYYYKMNDYKDVVLQDVIDNYRPLTFSMSNLSTSYTAGSLELYDSEGEVATSIPKYLTTESGSNNYTVLNKYSIDISFNVIGTLENQTFTVDILNISITNYDAELSISHNAEVTTLYNSTSGSTLSLDDITSEVSLSGDFTEDSYKGELDVTINSPMIVDYLTTTALLINYSLENLNVKTLWLLYNGGSTHHWIYTCSTYTNMGRTDDYDLYGDDTLEDGILSWYSHLYSKLSSDISNYDALFLKFRTHHEAKAGDLHSWTIVGKGDVHGGGDDRYLTTLKRYTAEIEDDGAAVPIYGFQTTNGDLQLFLPAKRDGQQWYGLTNPTTNLNTLTGTYKPFGLRTVDMEDDDKVLVSLNKYYKLVESSETRTVYEWTRITYYDDYTWEFSFPYLCSATFTLIVNGVELSNFEQCPNNLKYTPTLNFYLSGSISDSISCSLYSDSLAYTSSSLKLVQLPDGSIVETEESTSNVFDENLNVISYLKQDTGDGTELASMENSKHKILISNDKLVVKVGSYSSNLECRILGRLEELALSISGLIQINDVT